MVLVIADFGACGEAMSCVRVHRLKAVIARNDASGMCKSANDATTVRIALLKVYFRDLVEQVADESEPHS